MIPDVSNGQVFNGRQVLAVMGTKDEYYAKGQIVMTARGTKMYFPQSLSPVRAHEEASQSRPTV